MNAVKELLEQTGMQQKELALAAGVSQPTVSEWVNKKKDPSGERLNKVADFFGVGWKVVKGLEPIPGAIGSTITSEEERELWELREQLRRDPERHILFSMARDADIEDVRQAVAVIDALKKTRR